MVFGRKKLRLDVSRKIRISPRKRCSGLGDILKSICIDILAFSRLDGCAQRSQLNLKLSLDASLAFININSGSLLQSLC